MLERHYKPFRKYSEAEVWFPLSRSVLDWDEDFHNLLLNDPVRTESYKEAIFEVIQPRMTVVDLGTGTGILALFALQAGASKVYGVELNASILNIAQQNVTKAGFADRFIACRGSSYDVELPEKVDLIISELLGGLVDDENITPCLRDARHRFLKHDGTMLPRRASMFLVPIDSETLHRQVEKRVCQSLNANYDLAKLLKGLNSSEFDLYYDAIIPKKAHLSSPQIVREFSLDGNDAEEYQVERKFVIERDGKFTGLKGYFIAELSPQVVLDTSSDDIANGKASESFKHAYLPVHTPIDVRAGDVLQLIYSRSTRAGSAFNQSYTWKGHLLRNEVALSHFCQTTR